MKIFELKCEAYLKIDITLRDSFDVLSKYINCSMYQNKIYEEKNRKKVLNDYCFGNFYPTESDKIYKGGNIYKFIIRSIDENFINQIEKSLKENINNDFIELLSTTKKDINQFFITELYSATPVIVSDKKDEKGKQLYWSLHYNGDILVLQKELQKNLEKKLKEFYSESIEISQNFIQLIEMKNQKPQSISFKTMKNEKEQLVRLIGNKFKIVPNEDEISQKLAFLSLGVGLGEKSSLGGGFCLSRGRDF